MKQDYPTVLQSFTKYLSFLFLLLAIASCNDGNNDYARGTGAVNLELNVDNSIISGYDDLANQAPQLPDLDDFSITMTDNGGAYSHTWSSFKDFPQSESYLSGSYTISASIGSPFQEGFDCPYFHGECPVTVTEGTLTTVSITATLANTMVSIDYSDAFKARFASYSATLHSAGGSYITYPSDEVRPAYLRPGDISLGLSLTDLNGRSVTFQPAAIKGAKARNHYRISLDLEGDHIIISYDPKLSTDDVTVPVTDTLFDGKSPVVTTEGFTSGKPVRIPEGELPPAKLTMKLNAPGGMAQVMLTTQSTQLAEKGWPEEINLCNPGAEQLALLKSLGLKWETGATSGSIDFTDIVNSLDFTTPEGSRSLFMVVVKDALTRVNTPATLDIDIEPVDLSVISSTPAMIGINRAIVTVSCPSEAIESNISVEALGNDGATWSPMIINSITPIEGSQYRIDITLPKGTSPVKTRVLYRGTVKATLEIGRVSPLYTIDIDPFALTAALRVNADDRSMVPIITELIKIYIDGTQAAVLHRDNESGLLTLTGLKPSTTYKLTSTLVDTPTESNFTSPILFKTEGTPQLPNHDFENIKETIKIKDLLCGGRYSQNIVEIFNGQNKVDYLVSTPTEGWANTNAKTCSAAAKNQNTWYMQPSAMIVSDAANDGYGVKLVSVAYDLDGPAIPNYLQESMPFTSYSRHIPPIARRAAGRLFLGGYSFDPAGMTEHYKEGIRFNSRPSALNGFYKYQPCHGAPSDRGLVTVDVLGEINGKETTIASARAMLPIATDYTAFAIPLTYKYFGVKATRLKVMAASSAAIGTIEEESRNIVTIADPVTASSTGSVLWIDNFSLSY